MAVAAEIRTKEYFATVLPQLQAAGLAEPEAVEEALTMLGIEERTEQ